MGPYRKPFFGDPLFPFHMIHKTVKHPQYELPDHLHELYELVYVYEGSGTFFIDQTLYDKKPGNLFLIPGNTVHRAMPEEANPIVSTALFFAPALAEAGAYDDAYSLLHSFDIARKRKRYKYELPPAMCAAVETVLTAIHTELDLQQQGYRASIRLELGRLLVMLNRFLSGLHASGATDNKSGPLWIKSALHEIDAHPEQPFSLRELAAQASVSDSHFSRAFKQYTGMNVTDYINAKRIIMAKELLTDSNDNIANIAERCGFASLPHFHRTFKALTNATPSSYRKQG